MLLIIYSVSSGYQLSKMSHITVSPTSDEFYFFVTKMQDHESWQFSCPTQKQEQTCNVTIKIYGKKKILN